MLKWIWQRLTGTDTQLSSPDRQSSAQRKLPQVTDRSAIATAPSITSRSSYKAESVADWISAEQTITIAGYVIRGGMIYVGKRLPTTRDSNRVDPCLINPQLKVDRLNPDHLGSGMSYWPSYKEIPASCRAAYLDWLAQGRSQPDSYIGYVFLFFYGLERRVFVDLKGASVEKIQELELIAAEVERLLQIYGNNGSLNSYATRLLEICHLLKSHESFYEISPPLTRNSWEIPFKVRIALGQLVEARKPIPADWALSWYIHSPQARLRTPATRCAEEFQQLFRSRYQQQYGEGLVIKPNKTKLKCSYHAASAAFEGSIAIEIGDLPDVTALSAPLNRLQTLVDDCTDALDPFSRWLGRNPEARGSHAAIALLPPELIEHHESDETKTFRQWLKDSFSQSDQVIVSAKVLLQHWQPQAVKLAKAEAMLLSQFLEKHGYGIEPDIRFGGKILSSEGTIVLFKCSIEVSETLSADYSAATLLLHLAATIANADGTVDASEQAYLESHLESALDLSEPERLRLRAHLTWLLQEKLSLRGLKPRLEGIAPEKRTEIAQFLVSVARADGQISPKEISMLTKIYPLLGFEPKMVYSHIHQFSTAQAPSANEPVTVRPASFQQKGFAIPAPLNETKREQDEKQGIEFVLDKTLIEAKKAESAAVAAILGDIFTEDELPTPAIQETSIAGLDAPHSELVRRIGERSRWSRDELESVVTELGLMIDGALGTLNEAAFDHCEELLTEGDDPIEVNSEVLEGLLS
jgi:tellurite resistance protein